MTTNNLSTAIISTLDRYADRLAEEGIPVDQRFLEELGQTLFCQALGHGLDRETAFGLVDSALGLELVPGFGSGPSPAPGPAGSFRSLQA